MRGGLAYKSSLALLGLGTGTGFGVVVPLTVEYSRNSNAAEALGLISGSGDEVTRSKRGTEKNERKSPSSVDDLLDLLFKRNRRQMNFTYNGLGEVMDNRFEKLERSQEKEWDKVEKDLLDVRGIYRGITKEQKERIENQGQQISSKLSDLKVMVKDIKDTQNNLMHWQDKYSNRELLPRIDNLISGFGWLKSR